MPCHVVYQLLHLRIRCTHWLVCTLFKENIAILVENIDYLFTSSFTSQLFWGVFHIHHELYWTLKHKINNILYKINYTFTYHEENKTKYKRYKYRHIHTDKYIHTPYIDMSINVMKNMYTHMCMYPVIKHIYMNVYMYINAMKNNTWYRELYKFTEFPICLKALI